MDIGLIITDIIVFILTVVIGYVWKVHLLPYLQDKHLAEAANIVVHAAEAAYGAGHGSEKLAYAINMLNVQYGINVDSDKIVGAIEAAWKMMDIEQDKTGQNASETME